MFGRKIHINIMIYRCLFNLFFFSKFASPFLSHADSMLEQLAHVEWVDDRFVIFKFRRLRFWRWGRYSYY